MHFANCDATAACEANGVAHPGIFSQQSILIAMQITWKMEEFLSLNTLSFLYSHSDQINAIAPTLICFLNLLLISFSQFPNILVILHGENKVKATWMTNHIDLAKRY
jgi:hypothetical protein